MQWNILLLLGICYGLFQKREFFTVPLYAPDRRFVSAHYNLEVFSIADLIAGVHRLALQIDHKAGHFQLGSIAVHLQQLGQLGIGTNDADAGIGAAKHYPFSLPQVTVGGIVLQISYLRFTIRSFPALVCRYSFNSKRRMPM